MVNKVSDITAADLANYIRLGDISEDTDTTNELNVFLNVAKNYISNYTGIQITGNQDVETLDSHDDFIIAVYIIVQDMYDNRALYVEGKELNRTVQTILDMHTRNNL